MDRFSLLFGGSDINKVLKDTDIYLAGKYKLERIIGSGTFGDVFIADGKVLKIVSGHWADKEVLTYERLLSKCGGYVTCYVESFIYKHPKGDFLVIVQELLDRDLLAYNMKVEQASRLLVDLLMAVDCLHQSGIAHMDIKPENILIKYPFTVKLSDLGLICDERASIDECSARGTYLPSYILENINKYEGGISFDQARSVDLWGVGITLVIKLAQLGYYNKDFIERFLTGTYFNKKINKYIPLGKVPLINRPADMGFIPQSIIEEIISILLSNNTKKSAHGILLSLIKRMKLSKPGEEEFTLESWKKENNCFEQV